MLIERLSILAGLAAATVLFASPANALSMAECSARYNAAKEAGTLDGKSWNQFRKAECGSGASTAAEAKASKKSSDTAKGDEQGSGVTMAACSDKYQAAKNAGTLNGMKWNDFRKAECGATVQQAKATAPDSAQSDTSGGGLSMAACSDKYQAAKNAGTLNGMKWNDFRKTECGAGAADDDTVPSIDEAKYSGDPATPKTKAPRGVKFPAAISKKFSNENPGRARMHTCLEQYYANKDADSLGGLRWIQKGGGYYSLCNARLKG